MKKLEKLKSLMPKTRRETRRSIDAETGREIIKAYRRGVSVARICESLDIARANVYATMGTWALHHCECGGRLPKKEGA